MIINLGCGLGRHYYDKNALNVDIWKPYVQKMKPSILADVRYLPFKPKIADLVLLLEVIEHLTKEEGLKLIKELEVITKDGILVSTPNKFIKQSQIDNNPYQIHKSFWLQSEFKTFKHKAKSFISFYFKCQTKNIENKILNVIEEFKVF